MVVVKIMIEKVQSVYVATALDDVGELCQVTRGTKSRARRDCKAEAQRQMEGQEIEWITNDLTTGASNGGEDNS